jgi:hypothetical protein
MLAALQRAAPLLVLALLADLVTGPPEQGGNNQPLGYRLHRSRAYGAAAAGLAFALLTA